MRTNLAAAILATVSAASSPSVQLSIHDSIAVGAELDIGSKGETSCDAADVDCALPDEWVQVERMQGEDFFDHFDFFTLPDPTNGMSAYQSRQRAEAVKLVYVDDLGNAIVKADSTTNLLPGQKRESVRLHSKNEFDEGLTVITVNSMPWGDCSGVWPAFWSYDARKDAWPNGGEIDQIEGIESFAPNMMTLHTNPGCTTAPKSSKNVFSGTVDSANCTVYGAYGCTTFDTGSTPSYGKALNDAGGGVWAMQFVSSGTWAGITIWRFPRYRVPDDLVAEDPQPHTWGVPSARWAATTCDYKTYFGPQTLILNIALGGDLNAWTKGLCSTGSLAESIVDPNKYVHAQWNISSIEVYQRF